MSKTEDAVEAAISLVGILAIIGTAAVLGMILMAIVGAYR